MTKQLAIGAAVGLLAAGSVFASNQAGCCAQQASNSSKKECADSYAKLNLTPEQKAKLDTLQAKCDKAGCTKESMAAFLKGAKGVLSPQQYATLEAECHSHQSKRGA